AGGELAAMLVRMDATPHRLRPETRVYKTLVLDRAARFAVRDGELELAADLEVRLYGADGSGRVRRAGALPALGAAFIGPRLDGALAVELAPLAEVAAWLAFLRRMERIDPSGVAALREACSH